MAMLGTAHEPRGHCIQRDATRRQQARLVHHHRAEAALENMTVQWNERSWLRCTAVRFGKSRPQPIVIGRRHDQADIIRHQAISLYLRASTPRRRRDQLTVQL